MPKLNKKQMKEWLPVMRAESKKITETEEFDGDPCPLCDHVASRGDQCDSCICYLVTGVGCIELIEVRAGGDYRRAYRNLMYASGLWSRGKKK